MKGRSGKVQEMKSKPYTIPLLRFIRVCIKTGGCSEDCSYCPQSSRYDTGVKAQRLMSKDAVIVAAKKREVCCTLGIIEKQQALELKKAGLTAYNHNLDTSRDYYPNVITN
ncbi:Biotin synthase [Raphanus sativus]|nr:Biotin synthase [Raphanus sativus]